MLRILLLLSLLGLGSNSLAHDDPKPPEAMTLDGLLKAFSWDLEGTEITTQAVTENLYVFFGIGGNIAVSIGDDGVLIVDDQFPQLMPKIKAAIGELNNKLSGKHSQDIDFVINTHWHFDHAEGNLVLGPNGTWVVAQSNSREMMKQDHLVNLVLASYEQKAYPEEAWPAITFDETMHFHFNGEDIDLLHFGPAHTTGDAAIYFRGANAVHLGDVFNNAGYPFIDAGNGGTLDGIIKFCSEILARINKDTVVIPGHGPVTNYQALVDYVEMLTNIRGNMMELVNKGASLDEVYAAKVTAEWDQVRGDNTGFINRAYMSLTRKVIDK